MSMPKITIVGGVVLVLLTVVGAVGAIQHGKNPMTSFTPFALGAVLILLGGLSLKLDHLRKHFMHVAAMVALLAVIGALIPMILRGSQMSVLSWICIGGMFVTGLVLEVLYVRSFIAAKKARFAAAAAV